MKQKNTQGLFAFLLLFSCAAYSQPPQVSGDSKIVIDVASPGAKIQPSMYGVFFEEINHSGDGGLYAELIQNRGFEDKNVPSGTRFDSGFAIAPAKPNYRTNQVRNFRVSWDMKNKWPGWSLNVKGSANATMDLTTEQPLNQATPHSMQITISQAKVAEPVELANEGFWGVGVKEGDKYNLRFFLRADNNYKGTVTAKLTSADGKVLAQNTFPLKKAGAWNEYKAQLTSSVTDAKASFALSFNAPGTVWVDYVSLFPEKTFKNRPNGMRADVAQLLADLKPAFVRWPGGCIVEGLTLENRVKWKETLGDPVTRPGEYDLWGYRNSYGFGYHEYLQFIEDIGAEGMFVANIGLSCSVRNGDYCTPEEVSSYIQDALDAIEYAIGDVKTPWGAKRAAAGHPAPFPLKYVEVGNENAGVEIYNERYNLFHKAISAKFPQITIISNHGLNDNKASVEKLDMIDPHYYVAPDWFYARSNNLFDTIKRSNYKTYVGEYAANRNVGAGNMNGALSEAAFLIGAERNSDYVTMTSYAPLIENSNKRDWPVNMIWVKSNQSMGRSSYYVQQVFAANRPDVNVKTLIQEPMDNQPKEPFKGTIGLATQRAQVEFKDFNFSGSGNNQAVDFKNWQPVDGQWNISNNAYIQSDTAGRHISFLKNQSVGNGTLEFNVQKKTNPNVNQGNFPGGGFGRFGNNYALLFGGTDDKNYYQLTFSNRFINLEKIVNGTAQYVTDPVRFNLDDDKQYAVKLVTNNDNVELFIDGQSALKYKYAPLIKHYAIAGIDNSKNEIVVKVVNAEATPFRTTINLNSAGSVKSTGQIITLAAASETDENTFEQPTKISPKQESFTSFAPSFEMEFKPYSLTVLRIKK
ncbi:MAG: alpha-L-arabinofuranosidase [Flavisolibacter sp.]|nr:alpha-L-arabinofuranosidase [Flavisolibacter sp.]